MLQKGPLFPTELRMNANGAKLSPQICPSNPDLVAYICNCDIWLSHTLTGTIISRILYQSQDQICTLLRNMFRRLHR